MTQWVESPTGGRDRGPRGALRAWFEVMVRPRRFFRTGVAPGDQAPGLTFAMAVVFIEEASRLALNPTTIPDVAGGRTASGVILLGVAVLLVTPAALHLIAALQTVLLIPVTDDRAGVSETVQTVAYAGAPCVLAGVPSPELRVVVSAYGAALFGIGLASVHGLSRRRAVVAGTLPAALVFGYGFRGFDAAAALLARWYII